MNIKRDEISYHNNDMFLKSQIHQLKMKLNDDFDNAHKNYDDISMECYENQEIFNCADQVNYFIEDRVSNSFHFYNITCLNKHQQIKGTDESNKVIFICLNVTKHYPLLLVCFVDCLQR